MTGSGHTLATGRERAWTVQGLCLTCGDALLAQFRAAVCFQCATGRERTLRPKHVQGQLARMTREKRR